MNVEEAIAECNRWFKRLEADAEKAKALTRLAGQRRRGQISKMEAMRKMAEIRGYAPTVYDGANLEKAVRTLIKEIQQ